MPDLHEMTDAKAEEVWRDLPRHHKRYVAYTLWTIQDVARRAWPEGKPDEDKMRVLFGAKFGPILDGLSKWSYYVDHEQHHDVLSILGALNTRMLMHGLDGEDLHHHMHEQEAGDS